ncbi:hypothetical protein FALCPG4_016048 [Fusarium falciforme]
MDKLRALIYIPFSPLIYPPLRWLGATILLYTCYKVMLNCFSPWLPPMKSMSRYRLDRKAWALITGSSAGIGFGCAQELAARGFNVILLGHKSDELEKARQQIKDEFPSVEVNLLVIDCTTASVAEIEQSVESISEYPITVLINNVGGVIAQPPPSIKPLKEYTGNEVDATINLNARFMTHMTRLMLPILDRNGPSLILNISSGAKMGLPGVAVYSGVKGFVTSISKAVGREARAEGMKVDVVAIVVGLVKTQSNNRTPPGTITGREFAREMLDRAPRAASKGMLEISPYWKHALEIRILESMPESLRLKALVNSFEDMKRAYMGVKDE